MSTSSQYGAYAFWKALRAETAECEGLFLQSFHNVDIGDNFYQLLEEGIDNYFDLSVIWTLMDGRNYFDGGYISTLQTRLLTCCLRL